MNREHRSYDATDLLDADALLDALGAGEVHDDDPLTRLLSTWRAELTRATPPSETAPAQARRPPNRSRRVARRTVAAATGLALLCGGGVAAAAISGPHGPLAPLHRILFGTSPTTDTLDQRITHLLNEADQRITTAQRAGWITVTDRARTSTLLDQATALLATDPNPGALTRRLADLRTALAALPDAPATQAPPTPVTAAPRQNQPPTHSSPSPLPPRASSRQPDTGHTPSTPQIPTGARGNDQGGSTDRANDQSGTGAENDQGGTGAGNDQGGTGAGNDQGGTGAGNDQGGDRSGDADNQDEDGKQTGRGSGDNQDDATADDLGTGQGE